MSNHEQSLDHPSTVVGWIADLVDRFPRRAPASPDEFGLQQAVAERFSARGFEVSWHRFSFGTHLYANLLLHFGLAVFATALAQFVPLAGGLLHLLVAVSYYFDARHKAFMLRRLLPWRASQNMMARLKADEEPALRVVIPCHADTAYTGYIFAPKVVARGANGAIKKPLALVTATVALLGVLELASLPMGWSLPLWIALPLTIPALIAAAGNLDVVLRNEIVPGAADNLSGIAAMTVLSERIAAAHDRRVEFYFVATGCEEASLGGATMMARDFASVWSTDNTLVLVLDGCSNGDLRYLVEGEMVTIPMKPALEAHLIAVAKSDVRFAEMRRLVVPVGGSDAAVFAERGYDAVSISRVDGKTGVPREYHLPSDTADKLDGGEILVSVSFAEALIARWVESKIGAPKVAAAERLGE